MHSSPTPQDAHRAPRYFAVVPAAGSGSRVGADRPKQYLEIGGRTLLEWTVSRLLAQPWIEQVLVVVAPDDARAIEVLFGMSRVRVVQAGGATRRDSVLGGLQALVAQTAASGGAIDDRDWVMVHDAARPGLTDDDLARLRSALAHEPVGGLLALPVADTVKRAGEDSRVARTISREGLWLAQTPQMFRLATLREALTRNPQVTDEAAAIEAYGLSPVLVAGSLGNFKVTTAADLALMRRLLAEGAPHEDRK